MSISNFPVFWKTPPCRCPAHSVFSCLNCSEIVPLTERMEQLDSVIPQRVRKDEACQRLTTIPGLGPVTATALVAAIGNGAAFRKGRDLAAWVGIVPTRVFLRRQAEAAGHQHDHVRLDFADSLKGNLAILRLENLPNPVRRKGCFGHRVSRETLCPLGQPEKAIGRESPIEPWLALHNHASFLGRNTRAR